MLLATPRGTLISWDTPTPGRQAYGFYQYCKRWLTTDIWMYTLLQKKLKFSKVAFLLEKIVCQWTLCQGE